MESDQEMKLAEKHEIEACEQRCLFFNHKRKKLFDSVAKYLFFYSQR